MDLVPESVPLFLGKLRPGEKTVLNLVLAVQNILEEQRVQVGVSGEDQQLALGVAQEPLADALSPDHVGFPQGHAEDADLAAEVNAAGGAEVVARAGLLVQKRLEKQTPLQGMGEDIRVCHLSDVVHAHNHAGGVGPVNMDELEIAGVRAGEQAVQNGGIVEIQNREGWKGLILEISLNYVADMRLHIVQTGTKVREEFFRHGGAAAVEINSVFLGLQIRGELPLEILKTAAERLLLMEGRHGGAFPQGLFKIRPEGVTARLLQKLPESRDLPVAVAGHVAVIGIEIGIPGFQTQVQIEAVSDQKGNPHGRRLPLWQILT